MPKPRRSGPPESASKKNPKVAAEGAVNGNDSHAFAIRGLSRPLFFACRKREVATDLEKLVESMMRTAASAEPEMAQVIAEWQAGLRNQITRLAEPLQAELVVLCPEWRKLHGHY